jgi:hypothetical protein
MIISFKNYLNESTNDDWTVVDNKDKKEESPTSKIKASDIIKHKKFKQKLEKGSEDHKQTQNKIKRKHMVPYDNDVDQNEMDDIERTNPSLYAALTNWN